MSAPTITGLAGGPALQGLKSADPRNAQLNSAYYPTQAPPSPGPVNDQGLYTPQASTTVDPFQGTPWGQWLDAAGAGAPGGMTIGGAKHSGDPLAGLRTAGDPDAVDMSPVTMNPVTMQHPAMRSLNAMPPSHDEFLASLAKRIPGTPPPGLGQG